MVVVAASLGAAGGAFADPSGRSYTTTIFVAHHDGFWINAYELPGTPAHACAGNHACFCPCPSCLSPGEDPANCHGNWNDPWDEYQTITANYPPATVSGAVSCSYGLGGWCVTPAGVAITGVEPVGGYSITHIGGDRDGAPFTCPGGSCSFTVTDTPSTTFTYQAFSTFGDSSYASATTLRVDTISPATTHSLTGPSGASGWHVGPVTVSLTPSDATSGVAGVMLNGSPYTAPVTFNAEGANAIVYYSTDNAGNAEAANTASFNIDTVAPGASVTSHTAGQFVGSVITLGGSASDATSGVAGVDISVDGGATWSAASGATTWSRSLNTTLLPDGLLTLLVRASDIASNTGVETLLLNVDNTPPRTFISPDCPLPGASGWCRGPVAVSLSANDSGAGIASLTYTHNDKAVTINGSAAQFVAGQGGTHTVTAYATDALGHRSPVESAVVLVDGAPPSLDFTGASASGLFVSIADSESGVKSWTVQVFDAASGASVFYTDKRGAFWGTVPVSLAPGAYTVEIFASDEAGNESHFGRTAFIVLAQPTTMPTATEIVPVYVVSQPTAAAIPATATAMPTATAIPPTPAAMAVVTQREEPEPQKFILVEGVVFRDTNGNGAQDAGEPGIGGARVEIVTAGGAAQSLISDATGAYSARVPAGKRYLLRIVPPLGLLLTTPGSVVVMESDVRGYAAFGFNMRGMLAIAITLIVVLMFSIWLATAMLDRRPSAMRSLAGELVAIRSQRKNTDNRRS